MTPDQQDDYTGMDFITSSFRYPNLTVIKFLFQYIRRDCSPTYL